MVFTPDAGTDVSAEVMAQILEEDIALGLLHPRERLIEDALMERFAAKRHVVRSALSILEGRGAVERRPHAGALVRSYSAGEVRDLYEVRELLERHCAQSILMPVQAEALESVVDAGRRHADAVGRRDHRAALRANLEFHDQLYGLAPNGTLVSSVRYYQRRSAAMRFVTIVDDELLDRARAEHQQMIEALREGDSQRLADLCAQHLHPSRDAYLAMLERHEAL